MDSENAANHVDSSREANIVAEDQWPRPVSFFSPQVENRWSWGAFVLAPVFLFGVGRGGLTLWYLLAVPLLYLVARILEHQPNIVAALKLTPVVFFLGMSLFFGLFGRGLCKKSTVFKNQEQYNGFMLGIDRAAKTVLFVIGGALLILIVLVGLMQLSMYPS